MIVSTKVKLNNTMHLPFVSLKDIYGTDHIYPSPYLAQYQGKLVKTLNMDSLWHIHLMEGNAVFMKITKLTMLRQNQF